LNTLPVNQPTASKHSSAQVSSH